MSGAAAIRFAGYAAVFDRVDQGGDVVRPGAFARSLARGGDLPLLWEHKAGSIGRVELAQEDGCGLRVIGRVSDPLAARLLASGAVTGLSFGYRVGRADGTRPRMLLDVELMEISLVSFPMQPAAGVHAIEKSGRDLGWQQPSRH